MLIAFLTWIFDGTNWFRGLGDDEAKEFFKNFVSGAVGTFCLESLEPLNQHWIPARDRQEYEPQALSFARTTASFLCQCKTLGYDLELSCLIQRLVKGALELETVLYGLFFLPLLKDLIRKLKDR